MRVVCGIRLAFQAERCRFEPCSPLQFYLSKALSGCVHGLGPCGPGSNPGRETSFALVSLVVEVRSCKAGVLVRFRPGAPIMEG